MTYSPRSPVRTLAAVVLGVLILATAGGATWYVLSRDDPSGPGTPNGGTDEHPVTFELAVSRVGVRSVAEREPDRDAVDAAAEEIRASVQDLYLGGFVDPERWAEGEFPDAFRNFEEGAAAAAREKLNSLTLGAAAGQMDWVEPSKGRCSIVFLLDDQSRPAYAVAGVVFEATGHLDDGSTVGIVNGADLVLRPVEGEWRVFSFTASTDIAPPDPDPSPTGSAS